MTIPAQQDFCAHGFNLGFCPHSCMKLYYNQELAREKRKEFLRLFQRKRGEKHFWNNPVTRATIIMKLQQFHREEQYVQLPINLVTIHSVRMYERPVDLTPQTN